MSNRALLMGINYVGAPDQLFGCVNDAENLADYLVASKFVTQQHATILREPGAHDIVRAIVALAAESRRTRIATVFISYSGHGTYVHDTNGDERDGCDECLCPADHETAGLLRDDEMNDLLSLFAPSTRVVLLMDCCHSGTIMDLPYRYTSKTGRVHDAATAGCHPRVVMISGCADEQTSADAYDGARREYTGAMTSAFLDALAASPALLKDAFALLEAMRSTLKVRGMSQVPQLSTSIAPTKTTTMAFM